MHLLRRYGYYILILVLVVLTAFSLIACTSSDDNEEKGTDIVSIRINNVPSTEIYQGESIALNGATIMATRRDGDVVIVDLKEEMLSGYDKNLLGKQVITVTYEKCTTTFEITVVKTNAQGISILKRPANITVVQGGDLSLTGVSISVQFETYSVPVDTITSGMVHGYSKDLPVGTHTVYISYAGYSASLEIEVLPKSLTKINIVTAPDKKQYFVNEILNASGLSVKRTYDNGTEDVISFAENPNEFEFKYNFGMQNAHSIVEVYVDGKYDSFECVIKEPVVNKFEVDVYPVTHSIELNGVELYPSGTLMDMVEGQRINWSTGSGTVYYDDGREETVQLSSSSVYPFYGNTSGDYLSKEHCFDEVGERILYVRYGNTEKYAQVHITVKEKTARELLLGDTRVDGEKAEDRVYIEGDVFSTAFLRYNVLYDNGTYAFDIADVGNWGSVDPSMLADNGSSFDLSTSRLSGDGKQHITFVVGKVYADYKITVVPKQATAISVYAPYRNVYAIGSMLELDGSYVFAEYNNSTSERITPIPTDAVKLYNAENVEMSNHTMSTVGTYTAVVTVGGLSKSFTVEAVPSEELVTSVTIEGHPLDQIYGYASFEDIPFDTMSMSVTRGGVSSESRLFAEAELLNEDARYASGVQTLIFRFEGYVFNFNVDIQGRRVSSIEISAAPSKLIYTIGQDTELDIKGLLITKVFNDGGRGEQSVFDELWSFSGYDLTEVGEQTVYVKYSVEEGRYYTASFNIEVTEIAVKEIAFDTTQAGVEEFTLNGETFRGVKVTYRDDINLTFLHTYLDDEGISVTEIRNLEFDVIYENGITVKRDLKASYISYNKNVNPDVEGDFKQTVSINYGGKTTNLNVYVVNRQLETISVYELPDTLTYADGQQINNAGGYIERLYSDGSTDILPMTNGLIAVSGYVASPFANVLGGKYVDQQVVLTYGGKETFFTVRTYRKLLAEPIIGNSLFYYGDLNTPVVTIRESISGFTIPETTLEYLVDGTWTSNRPVYPGVYPLRINVLENEYYEGEVIENDGLTLIIRKKAIILYIDELTKSYMDNDPAFSYRLKENELVGNDVVEITLSREAGEDVKYVTIGGVKSIGSYLIKAELTEGGNNQNGLYDLAYSEVGLTINPKKVTQTASGANINVDFVVPNNLVAATNSIKYTGAEIQPFSAKYTDENGYTIQIASKDILYYDASGNKLTSLPKEIGRYEVRISENYSFSGVSTRTFEIIQ